jgi:hypothetical protein
MALAQAQAEASEKVTQALGPDAFDGDALSFLQALYRDTAQAVETRLHAARAAIAYERPRLAAVTFEDGPSHRNLEKLTDAELQALEAIQLKLSAQPLGDATAAQSDFLAVVAALDDAARVKVMQDFEEIARKVAQEI